MQESAPKSWQKLSCRFASFGLFFVFFFGVVLHSSIFLLKNLANLKASTAVDLSKLSAEITTGLEPVVDVLKAELARHASCTKKGMLFDKSADDCTYAKVITCGPLAVPKESKRVPEASCTSIFPLSCNLVCPAGFAARAGRDAAKITSQCGEDGQWSVIESHKMLTPECDDIDECSANEKVCSEGSSCVNTPGSYVCKCAYTVTESGGCQKYGKSSFKFNRASETETFVVPGNGVIKYNIEVWGSGGGASRYYSGGTGGYTTATFEIKSGTKLIVSIGGPGFGIGHGKQKTTTYIGQGGGLSGVFVNSVSQKNSLIIAGSGGGAGDNRARAGGSGGYAGTVGGYVHSSVASTMGRGATQTKGGDAGVLRHASWGPRGYAGGALAGGHGGEHGSGGGAGYFGGGGGSHYGGLCGCAGGGGSSYVEETSGFGNSVKYISGKNFKTAKGSPGEPKNLRNRGGATYGTVVLMTPIYD